MNTPFIPAKKRYENSADIPVLVLLQQTKSQQFQTMSIVNQSYIKKELIIQTNLKSFHGQSRQLKLSE
jgi:hypothetical protein